MTPFSVSCGALRQRDVGEQDVCLVLLAFEPDTDEPTDGAVRAVASDDVLGPDGRAVRARHRDAVRVLGQPDDLRAAHHRDAHVVDPGAKHVLGAALRDDQQHPEPRRQLTKVHRDPARRRDLVDRDPARQQLVGHPPRVEQLERARVYGERPGDVRYIGALLEQLDPRAAERQFAGQHQSGGACADHYHIACVHDAGC